MSLASIVESAAEAVPSLGPFIELGGWGALLAVVYWFMRRLDKQAGQLDKAQEQTGELIRVLSRAVESFERFEHEGRAYQAAAVHDRERILSRLEALAKPA